MTDIDVHHLAAAYALDALDDRERSAFEAHYGACEVCRTDVQEFRHTLTQVSDSLVSPPPPSLKDKVMAEVAATRQLSPLVAPVVALDERRRTRNMMAPPAGVYLVALCSRLPTICARRTGSPSPNSLQSFFSNNLGLPAITLLAARRMLPVER